MSTHIHFGGGLAPSCRTGTADSIARFLDGCESVPQRIQAVLQSPDRKYYDGGGWSFSHLELEDYERFDQLLDAMEAALPEPISNWTPEWRPHFYKDFARVRAALRERIAQLRAE